MGEYFRSVPVKYIDWFISSCVAVILFTGGMLRGGGCFSPVGGRRTHKWLCTRLVRFSGPPFLYSKTTG